MRLVRANVGVLPQIESIEDAYKQIELAGRTSYKSEYKITGDSYKTFIDKLIANRHFSPLEFGTVYLKQVQRAAELSGDKLLDRYAGNPYSRCVMRLDEKDRRVYYVTTNYRVIVENHWEGDLKYTCAPGEFHERRVCVKFICDRGIMCELTRHRHFSFMVESSRYCNYSHGRFGKQCAFIIPVWFEKEFPECENVSVEYSGNAALLTWNIKGVWDMFLLNEETRKAEIEWIEGVQAAEDAYNSLVACGWKAEQARSVLPNALKTEVYMCGYLSDWHHFFQLRCAKSAHPQMRELTVPLRDLFGSMFGRSEGEK